MSESADVSLSWANGPQNGDGIQRLGLALVGVGIALFFGVMFGLGQGRPWLMMNLVFGLTSLGAVIHIWRTYLTQPAGIRNDGAVTRSAMRGWTGMWGWVLAVAITGFYVIRYYFHGWAPMVRLDRMLDPIAGWFGYNNDQATYWFSYTVLYTFAIVIMGVRALVRYRHSRYQIIRTSVVMFAQTVLAFLVPFWMAGLNGPEFYPSYFWPLSQETLMPDKVAGVVDAYGNAGRLVSAWSLGMILIATPILTYFLGKRWYCSWVCGCGGLANTLGDPWRHLSSKKRAAWKLERVTIYAVLVVITVITVWLWIDRDSGVAAAARKHYGFFIGASFSGVLGVGLYPLLGTRVWCRFGCPMAAIMGLIQRRKSRFRITTNGSQCISCGNCSKYCEMGIDVRWYAQRGQDVVRASCVGCGMCSAVCPRGVLNLENGPEDTRNDQAISLLEELKALPPLPDRK